MDKYVFPPKFDFTRHQTVRAIQMYAFEFSTPISRDDLGDIWQNLPPDIAEIFEHKEVQIEEEELIKALVEESKEIRWMVFKVKKRAQKNFERYRRSLIVGDAAGLSRASIGKYSYNWPYDYFSLVELVKIDETVQYVSADLTDEPDSTTQIVGDVNVNIVNPVTVADPGFDNEG